MSPADMIELFRMACRGWGRAALILAGCLTFSASTWTGLRATGTTGVLEGRVRDKTTHAPLAAVNVLIVGTNQGTVTDDQGKFQIPNVRAGMYDLRFSLLGYQRVVMTRIVVVPDLRTRADLDMEQSAVDVEGIVVRGERPLIQPDQAATAYSLGETQIDRLPISSFVDAVGLQPGVTREGNVRGGRTSEVLYLIDGLPVQDVISGGLGASLPKSAITGMTVWTGGFDAEYGNAMSGVVNVVTKSGSNDERMAVRLESDHVLPDRVNKQTDRAYEGELTASGSFLRDQLFYFTSNDVLLSDTRWWQDASGFFPSPIRSEFSGFSKIEYVPTPTLRLALQGIYSFQRWRDYEFSWRYNLSGLPRRTGNSVRVALQLSNTISDRTYYTASLSVLRRGTQIGSSRNELTLQPYEYDLYLRYVIAGARNWWAENHQWISTLKGDVTSQINDTHLLKAGIEINQYDINSDLIKYEPQVNYFGKPLPLEPMLNYSNSYRYLPRSGSAFVQDKVQVHEDGSILTFGLRWDFLDPTADRPIIEYIPVRPNEYTQQVTGKVRASFKHQISPRMSFAGPIGPKSFFFVNFGQYFQFPLFDYLYSGLNPIQLSKGAKTVTAGNPNLEAERLIAWEIGFKHSVNDDVVFSLTFFQKQIKNQIDARTFVPFDSKVAGDYGFASYVNTAEANASGIEVVLTRERSERMRGTVSYTYMSAEGVSEYADQKINIAQWGFAAFPTPYPLSWDQRHTFKADVDVLLPGDVQGNVVAMFSSPKPYTYYPTRDGYTAVDTTRPFVPNNARMESVATMDVKLTRRFKLKEEGGPVVTAFADIRNLFNARNVRWMDSNGRVGGELGDPSAYYDLRRVRVGFRVEF